MHRFRPGARRFFPIVPSHRWTNFPSTSDRPTGKFLKIWHLSKKGCSAFRQLKEVHNHRQQLKPNHHPSL